MLRCSASFVIAAYDKYGRRNAGPQDLRSSHIEQAERRYIAIPILAFYINTMTYSKFKYKSIIFAKEESHDKK
jgi:hypothetical protein